MVLHEAAVRGNAWSTLKGRLYAIRHANVKARAGNPLLNKPRLWQVMDGLKKYRPPGKGKHPVHMGMLKMIDTMLDWADSDDDLVMWVAVLTAFHFMMRSAEYLAKLVAGRFDMSRVLRRGDVRFFINGQRITTRLWRATEVQIVFGRSKTTEGGEVRSHTAVPGSKFCVVAALAMLCDRLDMSAKEEPLFKWLSGSRRKGEGARYPDMMALLKKAGENIGLDQKDVGTHSLRRGGAQTYLLAGATLHACQVWGRWKSESSLRRYVEGTVGNLMAGFAAKVIRGEEDPTLLKKEPPRPRDVMLFRAKQRLNKIIASNSGCGMD